MIADVHSIYSQSVHALALNAGSMDNDADGTVPTYPPTQTPKTQLKPPTHQNPKPHIQTPYIPSTQKQQNPTTHPPTYLHAWLSPQPTQKTPTQPKSTHPHTRIPKIANPSSLTQPPTYTPKKTPTQLPIHPPNHSRTNQHTQKHQPTQPPIQNPHTYPTHF